MKFIILEINIGLSSVKKHFIIIIMLFSLQTLTNVLLEHIIVVRMVSASTPEVRTPVNVIQDTMEMDLPVQVRNTILIHVLHERKHNCHYKTACTRNIWFINM